MSSQIAFSSQDDDSFVRPALKKINITVIELQRISITIGFSNLAKIFYDAEAEIEKFLEIPEEKLQAGEDR